MTNILNELGSGEIDILEFEIDNKNYAINIMKVIEVLGFTEIKKIPNTHPSVAGLMLNRKEITTLIDLPYVLEGLRTKDKANKVIICQFNQIKVAFIIDNIVSVHRLCSDKILKPSELFDNTKVTGNVMMGDRIIFILDLEGIANEISPIIGIKEEELA